MRFIHQPEGDAVLIGKLRRQPDPELRELSRRHLSGSDIAAGIITEIMRIEDDDEALLPKPGHAGLQPLKLGSV